jgi:hypothetical protein
VKPSFNQEAFMEQLPLDPVFYNLLAEFAECFTTPSFQNFVIIACGWIQCANRRTITGMIEAAGVAGKIHHERFHRLFSQGRFEVDELSKIIFLKLVERFIPAGEAVKMGGDDTLAKKTGRKIFGAGYFRDGVLSTKNKTVTRWGLNFVVLSIILRFACWPGRDISFPFMVRLHRKQSSYKNAEEYQTTPQLLIEMVKTVAKWLPERRIELSLDGGYANEVVVANLPENVCVVSRTRSDATLYDLKPAPTGKAGRPRSKGEKQPKPKERVVDKTIEWTPIKVCLYGEEMELEVATWVGLWYKVAKSVPLRFVLVRKPHDHSDWICIFSTDVTMSVATILLAFGGRWSIEVAFYEAKQYLGVEQSQSRKQKAVERLFPLGCLLLSLVKFWFITYGIDSQFASIYKGPWNLKKTEPAFSDMLAALRRAGWAQAFFINSASNTELHNIISFLTDRLARAA